MFCQFLKDSKHILALTGWIFLLSCIGCGLVQAHYAFANVSHKSYTTVKYFIKMLSSTSDAIIFLFLGMVLVNDVHEWHTGFVLWTLLLCLVVRFFGIAFLWSKSWSIWN